MTAAEAILIAASCAVKSVRAPTYRRFLFSSDFTDLPSDAAEIAGSSSKEWMITMLEEGGGLAWAVREEYSW